MKTINKSIFAQRNDNRFCFVDGIISLPVGHLFLDDYRQYKKDSDKKN